MKRFRFLASSAVALALTGVLSAQNQNPTQPTKPSQPTPPITGNQKPPAPNPAQPPANPNVNPNQNANNQNPNAHPNQNPNANNNQNPNINNRTPGATFQGTGEQIRGQVTRSENGQVTIRTPDNRDVTLWTDPQTRYQMNNQAARFNDLRVGANVNAWYSKAGDRFNTNAISVLGANAQVGVNAQNVQGTGQQIQGTILRRDNDRFVVRTQDNREVTLITNPQTRFLANNQAMQFNDLRVGGPVTAWYTQDGNNYTVNTVTWANAAGQPVQANPGAGTFYEGEIVRVVGSDQVVVRTADNQEVTVYVHPQTTYRFNDQAGRFTDLRPGGRIRVDYELRDRRPFARGILGLRRDR